MVLLGMRLAGGCSSASEVPEAAACTVEATTGEDFPYSTVTAAISTNYCEEEHVTLEFFNCTLAGSNCTASGYNGMGWIEGLDCGNFSCSVRYSGNSCVSGFYCTLPEGTGLSCDVGFDGAGMADSATCTCDTAPDAIGECTDDSGGGEAVGDDDTGDSDTGQKPENTNPTVYILRPSAGESGVAGEPFAFDALVGDAEDGAASLSVMLASNVEGTVWIGSPDSDGHATGTISLIAGSHTLTFTVEDSEGASASASTLFAVATE